MVVVEVVDKVAVDKEVVDKKAVVEEADKVVDKVVVEEVVDLVYSLFWNQPNHNTNSLSLTFITTEGLPIRVG